MTATAAFATSLPSTSLPSAGPNRARTSQQGQVRSPVQRAVSGVAAGTATAARFAGHFVAACVSVAVLGTDADL